MKKTILAIVILSMAFISKAQNDSIYLNSGKLITGKVGKVAENTVSFTYSGEQAEQILGKYAINKIIFGGIGREQDISEKIEINGKNDWQKVVILETADEVAGLKRVDEIKGKTSLINYRTGAGSDKKSLENLKKAAAEKGCPFIYITSDKDIDRKSASGGGLGQFQSVKKGVAYSY